MKQSTSPKPGRAQAEASLDHRSWASEEPHRVEREVPQGKVTKLDETEKEELKKYVLDELRREICPQFEIMEEKIRVLEERFSQEAASRIESCSCRSWDHNTSRNQSFIQKESSRMVSAEEFHQKEKECEKLKEEKKAIEKKLERVLANAMKSHKFSENLNDPCRESAVLEMYDRLMTREWEKIKCVARDAKFPMTYEKSRAIIKAVFDKCEEDLSQKKRLIFELLEIPFPNETTSLFDSEQLPPELVRDIKTHLKNIYLSSKKDFYQSKSKPALPPGLQTFQPLVEFTAACYKIYCLLLLQNPPIRAMWWTRERFQTACIEHVDKKDVDERMPLNLLWPVLACETTLVRKGVVYDLM